MSAALDRLLALPRFADAGAAAYLPGLDRMRALLSGMDHPEQSFPTIHVAGTNGKGSTASFAAAIAHAAGRRVGLHTSPHLLHVEERMRVDGTPAPTAWLSHAAERHADLFERVGPSFFEATVALSLLYFAEQRVDLAVVEVGLGGRLDATNVLVPVVSVVTAVGLDHTDLLGTTLPEIAREKAGIAKPGVPLLHAIEDPDARDALEETARRAGALLEAVRDTCRARVVSDVPLVLGLATPVADYGRVEVGLPGAHQAWNAVLAIRAAETAIPGLPAEAVRVGLREVSARSGLRGRGEEAAPGLTLDVAHNDDGWRVALAGLRVPAGGHLFALVGVMADKDAGALARHLARAGATALPIGLPGDRALSRDALAAVLRAASVPVVEVDGVAEALAWLGQTRTPADRVLVTGSHGTVAAVLPHLPAPPPTA